MSVDSTTVIAGAMAFVAGGLLIADMLWARRLARREAIRMRQHWRTQVRPVGCPIVGCRIREPHSHTEALIQQMRRDRR